MSHLKCFVLAIVLTFVGYSSWTNDYMTYNPTPVEVTHLYSGQSTGKYSSLEFIAVYRTDTGTIFDERVSASTYSQIKVGDKLVLDRRPFDIKQTPMDNALYFIGAIIVFAFCLMFAPVMYLASFSTRFNKWMNS